MSGANDTRQAGITLEDLAARRGLTVAQARSLVRPFLEAGVVVQHVDGSLELDRLVAAAIASDADVREVTEP